MKIKTVELVPVGWMIRYQKSGIKVWFKSESSHHGDYNRKSFVFPKEIEIDERFAEAIGLLLGDGDMHRKEKRHLTYTSIDVELAAFILDFLKKRLNLAEKDLTITIRFQDLKPAGDLALKLGVSKDKINESFSLRHHYPSINIQANGVVFRLMFERIFDHFIKSDFLLDASLRRGFLRGIFAAEGCVGIKYKEQYINQISFTLSSKEKNYVNLLQRALFLEGIYYKTVERGNAIDIIIQNWQNYIKCWQIGLFDRCERKKRAFLSVSKACLVYAMVENSDLEKLSENFSQNELAAVIGSWQGNVSRILKGKILLSLDQINILENKGFSFAIKNFRVGNLTELPYSKEIRELFRLPEKIKKQDFLD